MKRVARDNRFGRREGIGAGIVGAAYLVCPKDAAPALPAVPTPASEAKLRLRMSYFQFE
jgi:hypothetical protein